MNLMELALACLGLVGQALVGGGDRRGFMVWLLASLIAMPFFLNLGLFGMATLQGFYALLNLHALLRAQPIRDMD